MSNTKPALVTGGAGFVGRHLIRALLAREYRDIWVVDDFSTGRPFEEWLSPSWKKSEGDQGVTVYTSERGTLHVINADALGFFRDHALGCSPIHMPESFGDAFHLASIVGGRALIDGDPIMVASDLGIDAMFFFWLTRDPKRVDRVLYASSSAAYPTRLQGSVDAEALAEDYIDFSANLGTPDMTYGWSKLTGEYLAKLAHERYGVHVACIRPFSGYGEDQDLTYPTPSIALRVARGDDPVDVWGSGKQGRDFIHIDDCVDAFFPILDRVADGSGVNIGTGVLTSFIELIEQMLTVEGRKAEVRPLSDKPVGVASRYADTTKLFKEIGWRPKMTLAEGLKKTLDGARERLAGKDLPFVLD